MASSINQDDSVSQISDSSTVPDRHGFLGGSQYDTNRQRPRGRQQRDTVLRRERKWLKMLNNWTTSMTHEYKRVRQRCRKGIPQSVRARAWFQLCGAEVQMEQHPQLYQTLLNQPCDSKTLEEIGRDIHRQFPQHEMFNSAEKVGQKELSNILRAYACFNTNVGYCQAQAPIGAFLLMHLPAEQAFWALASISDRYLTDYFSPKMEVVQRDGLILQALVKKICPPVYKHLKKVGAEPMFYCTEWFLCAFTRTLPWDTLLRVWDMFLCEGVKVLFKTAICILIGSLGGSMDRKQCSGLCETLQQLRNPPQEVMDECNLIEAILRLEISEKDFEIEHRKQAKKKSV